MRPNHVNCESRIEILKVRTEQCIERKGRAIRKLEKEIAEQEKSIERIHAELRRREEHLQKLRARREVEEIKCFEEISKIHKEISKIAEGIGQPDRT